MKQNNVIVSDTDDDDDAEQKGRTEMKEKKE